MSERLGLRRSGHPLCPLLADLRQEIGGKRRPRSAARRRLSGVWRGGRRGLVLSLRRSGHPLRPLLTDLRQEIGGRSIGDRGGRGFRARGRSLQRDCTLGNRGRRGLGSTRSLLWRRWRGLHSSRYFVLRSRRGRFLLDRRRSKRCSLARWRLARCRLDRWRIQAVEQGTRLRKTDARLHDRLLRERGKQGCRV